jgi:uroporphyrinogen-III decarboxylase
MPEEMTSRERVLAAINLQKTDHIPCSVSFSHFTARHAGVVMADYVRDLDLQVDLAHKTFDELGGVDYPVVILSSMFNARASFPHMPVRMKYPGRELPVDSIPQVVESEIMPADGYDLVIQKGWTRYVKEDLLPVAFPESDNSFPDNTVTRTGNADTDRQYWEQKKVFLSSAAPPVSLPFEVFSYARSFEKFIVDLYRQPDKIIAASEAIIQEFINEALASAKSPGLISIAANRFSSRFISPQQFERFAFPYLKKAVETFIGHGFMIYFHLDQDWEKFLPYFQQFPEGQYVFHFDGMTDMFKAKEILGDRMCLMGDVPATLFKLGNPQEVENYCRRLIDVIGKGSGFILSAGCQVPDDARFENVMAMVDTARNYRPYGY